MKMQTNQKAPVTRELLYHLEQYHSTTGISIEY